MANMIYPNFYFLGSLIVSTFTFFSFLYFFVIQKKSTPTKFLTFTMVIMTLFHGAYFVSSITYHPAAAYHRYISLLMALLGSSTITVVFMNFPKLVMPRLEKIIKYSMFGITFLVLVAFIFLTFNTETMFHFQGHYWDFTAPLGNKIAGLSVMLFFLLITAIGGLQIYKTAKGERTALVVMWLSFITLSIVPGYFNTVSRDGIVPRSLFITTTVIMNLTGFFVLIVMYINTTRDRTTFMGKLVSISLLSILFSFLAASYYWLDDAENSYDQIKRQQTAMSVVTQEKSEDMAYQLDYNIAEQSVTSTSGQLPELIAVIPDIQNTLIYHQIMSVENNDLDTYKENIVKKLVDIPDYSRGFVYSIKNHLDSLDPDDPRASLKAYIEDLNDRLLHLRLKTLQQPLKNFKDNYFIFLESKENDYPFFVAQLKSLIEKTDLTGSELKQEALNYLSAMKAPGDRHYRGKVRRKPGEEIPHHFVAFMYINRDNTILSEIGYTYRSYRNYIARPGWHVAFIILGITLFVSVGFRIFFLGALVKPLQAVVEALKEVRGGNLDVKVPVTVEDEIGFLGHSFNRVIRVVKGARKRLEEYANELEAKVQERTAELQNTLNQVRALKEKQDGDYFLTSLLIQPLGRNYASSENVDVDFYVKQKKDFKFRRWQRDIGGDICIAHNVELRDREYTLFLNADAMGKSIQGAGGILVLGSVFHSIIERTSAMKAIREQYPERWLKNSFIELHKIFESFDGSMLISLALGLVDCESGLVYYINAEHPFTALYRDGKASFIEDELMFRKLGTQGVKGQIYIQTFQLEPGDVLIAGSDGRDDISLGVDEEGLRIINEDETLFLRTIEEASGELSELVKKIQSRGEITDDFSLIKVTYRGNENGQYSKEKLSKEAAHHMKLAKEFVNNNNYKQAMTSLEAALQSAENNLAILRLLVRTAVKLKDYEKADTYVTSYLSLQPGDSDFLYVASYVAKKIKDLHRAADLGERLRLRNPGIYRNLVNLAEIYLESGHYKRARELAEQAAYLEPEATKAKELLEKMG